ncbi:translation initiation factor IF-2-like [Indicator indicator]|uniref:translation initiation factor IF-2-like n=1 Tax=Indicator indicator TaxID=1002788 RepID=UPI0023DEFE3E|nr:translation initiation factor IF-2-like [Indicator indicator]
MHRRWDRSPGPGGTAADSPGITPQCPPERAEQRWFSRCHGPNPDVSKTTKRNERLPLPGHFLRGGRTQPRDRQLRAALSGNNPPSTSRSLRQGQPPLPPRPQESLQQPPPGGPGHGGSEWGQQGVCGGVGHGHAARPGGGSPSNVRYAKARGGVGGKHTGPRRTGRRASGSQGTGNGGLKGPASPRSPEYTELEREKRLTRMGKGELVPEGPPRPPTPVPNRSPPPLSR